MGAAVELLDRFMLTEQDCIRVMMIARDNRPNQKSLKASYLSASNLLVAALFFAIAGTAIFSSKISAEVCIAVARGGGRDIGYLGPALSIISS